jgi:CDP-paratose 2-epimerase
VELQGFLSYLIKVAVRNDEYTVFGYKGKQVRDQIHSADVVAAFDAFFENPRAGEAYNLDGGRENSAPILECFAMLGARLGRTVRWRYTDAARRGDHICYISSLAKLRAYFPRWKITRRLDMIVAEILEAEVFKESLGGA